MYSVRPLNHLCCRVLLINTTGLQCYHRGMPVTAYYDLAQRLAPNRPQVSWRISSWVRKEVGPAGHAIVIQS